MFDDFEPNITGFWQEPDFFLADLVSGFVNKGGMELGITLFVRGLVITGTLVSEQEYLEAMSSMFAAQAKKSLVKPTKEEIKTAEEVFDFTHLAEDADPETFRERALNPKPINPYADDDDDDFDDFDPELDESDPPIIRHLHLKEPVILQPQPAVSFSHSQVPILRLRLTQVDGWMIGKVTMEDDDVMDDFPPPPPINSIRH
ncbi:MAG: hypothetical protein K8L97_14715 [Anaerolineae bacterium]|nr:hypothetical protein [Anaerolineae bacterium]